MRKLSFSSFPMAKDNRSKHRRAPWDGAIRRKDFVPTKNSKVCGLHFVPGIAINNPESVDYVPSVKVGYEKRVSARENGPARGQSTGVGLMQKSKNKTKTPKSAFTKHRPGKQVNWPET